MVTHQYLKNDTKALTTINRPDLRVKFTLKPGDTSPPLSRVTINKLRPTITRYKLTIIDKVAPKPVEVDPTPVVETPPVVETVSDIIDAVSDSEVGSETDSVVLDVTTDPRYEVLNHKTKAQLEEIATTQIGRSIWDNKDQMVATLIRELPEDYEVQ